MDLSSPLSIVIWDTKNAAVNVLAQVYPGQFLNFGTLNVLSRQFFVVHVCVCVWTEGQVREVAKDQHHLKGLCSPNASSNFCVKTVNAHHVGENPMGWGRTDQQSMVWGLGDSAGWHRVRLATLSPFVCV